MVITNAVLTLVIFALIAIVKATRRLGKRILKLEKAICELRK